MSRAEAIAQLAGGIAALDFSAEEARLAEIDESASALRSALAKATERQEEINAMLGAPESAGIFSDGGAIADALLAGDSATQAATAGLTRQDLQLERDALRRATRDLRTRLDDTRRQVDDVRTAASHRVIPLAEPMVAELVAEARVAAGKLASCCAALAAVHLATGAGYGELLPIKSALTGADTSGRGASMLGWFGPVEVPADVSNALRGLADKGGAIAPRLITSTPMR